LKTPLLEAFSTGKVPADGNGSFVYNHRVCYIGADMASNMLKPHGPRGPQTLTLGQSLTLRAQTLSPGSNPSPNFTPNPPFGGVISPLGGVPLTHGELKWVRPVRSSSRQFV
jgi:hypothetical protein